MTTTCSDCKVGGGGWGTAGCCYCLVQLALPGKALAVRQYMYCSWQLRSQCALNPSREERASVGGGCVSPAVRAQLVVEAPGLVRVAADLTSGAITLANQDACIAGSGTGGTLWRT